MDLETLLTTAFDGQCRLYSLRTRQALKDYQGHESYINMAVYSHDYLLVLTACSDGFVRVFDARTSELQDKFAPPPPAHLNVALQLAVLALIWAPKTRALPASTFVLSKSNTIHQMSLDGKVMTSFTNGQKARGHDFVTMTLVQSRWLVAASEDGLVDVFSADSSALLRSIQLCEAPDEVVMLCSQEHADQ